MYCAERELSIHTVMLDEGSLETTTKRNRNVLAGTGMVRRRREPVKKRVDRALLRLQDALKNNVAVVWVDNFNKQRYHKNPDKPQDASINGTVFAVTPQPLAVAVEYHGWPTL